MEIKGIFEKILSGSISFALAGTLMLSGASELNASYIIDKPKYTQKIQHSNNIHYARLCDEIYEANLILCYFFINQEYLSATSQRQRAKKHIKILNKVIDIAKNRIENRKNSYTKYDEKVFYSSIAVRNILEEICDEDFMQIIGAYNQNIENFDIIAYAKGVLKATNEY